MSDLKGSNAPKSISAEAPPQTPQGKLTAFLQTSWLHLKDLLLRGRKGKERRKEGAGKERERRERTGASFNFLPHGAADVVTPLDSVLWISFVCELLMCSMDMYHSIHKIDAVSSLIRKHAKFHGKFTDRFSTFHENFTSLHRRRSSVNFRGGGHDIFARKICMKN